MLLVVIVLGLWVSFFFFFNDPATTEIYPLPLPDPLPISAISVALASRPWPAACALSRDGPLARTALSRAFVLSLAAARGGASRTSPRARRPAGGRGEASRARHAGEDDLLGGARIVALRNRSRGLRIPGQLPPSLHRGRPVAGHDRKRPRKALWRRLGSDHPQRARSRLREGGRIQHARLRHRGRAPVQM